MGTRARRMCCIGIVVGLLLIVVCSVSGVMMLPSDSRGGIAQAATGSVDDLLARCPTSAEVAAINAKLTLSFDQDPTAGVLACSAATGSADLTLLQQRAYQALLVMQVLEFDTPLPWTAKTLYDWFAGTVTGIRFRGDISLSFCCDPPHTLNIQTQNMDALQTDRWLSPDHPAGMQGLVVLLAHEARHSEGLPHTCGTNDQTLQELGAWGVQYYLLRWLADHSDPAFLTPNPLFPGLGPTYYRDQARNEAAASLQTRFCDLTSTKVAVDINPRSCPNPVNVNSQGTLPVAIVGTSTFDVARIDASRVRLAGVPPLRSNIQDVAAPFVPFTGKTQPTNCTTAGPDGFPDLVLQFDKQAVATALGSVTKGQVVVVTLTGNLTPAFGGTPIVGEDVVVIVNDK